MLSGRCTCVALLLATLAAAPARAQTGQTAQIPLQFDFLNPGARSLGLGSAFVAVADDATAAFTNPAGLTLSIRPETSLEIRYRRLDTPFLAGGRLSGVPSGQGLDTAAAAVYGNSADTAARPYFLSVVYPHDRWSVAGYRHELVLQRNAFVSQGAFYASVSPAGSFPNSRLNGLSGDRDIDLVTYGVSAAYRVSPHLSIGQGISLYHFNLSSRFGALGFQSGSFDGPVDLNTFGQGSTTTQDGNGWFAGFNVGALVTVNHAVRMGAVFRQGASFLFNDVKKVPELPTVHETGSFRTPMVVGAGVRVQPTEAWAFAVDYDRVQYSELTTHFITFQVDPSVADRVTIPGGNELHIGAEYTFLQLANKLSLRAGAWFDPDHAVRYTSDGSGSDADTRFRAVFPGGDSVWHYCGGFGLPLSRSYEINFGADVTRHRHYVAASLVARFGR